MWWSSALTIPRVEPWYRRCCTCTIHPPPYVTYETAVEFQITVHKSIHTPVRCSALCSGRAIIKCKNAVSRCALSDTADPSFDIRAWCLIYRGIDYFRIKLFARGGIDSTKETGVRSDKGVACTFHTYFSSMELSLNFKIFFYDIILIYVFLKYLIVLRSRGNGQKDTREEYEESTIKRM